MKTSDRVGIPAKISLLKDLAASVPRVRNSPSLGGDNAPTTIIEIVKELKEPTAVIKQLMQLSLC
jgi:hypothetical protein